MHEPDERQTAEGGGGAIDLRRGWAVTIVVTVVVAGVGILAGARGGRSEHLPGETRVLAPVPEDVCEPDAPGTLCVAPPPFQTEEVLDSIEETGTPCSACHNQDLPPNPKRRELSTHDDIVLHHDEANRWCLDCHDEKNRDKLRLASGALIDFSESYRLCGQCHGDKYRDWRLGIHGRRTGNWNGEKEYMLCVHCHWAHAPRFKPLEPMARPMRQGEIR